MRCTRMERKQKTYNMCLGVIFFAVQHQIKNLESQQRRLGNRFRNISPNAKHEKLRDFFEKEALFYTSFHPKNVSLSCSHFEHLI